MIRTRRKLNRFEDTKVMIVTENGITRLWINNKPIENVRIISFTAVDNNIPYLEYEVLE